MTNLIFAVTTLFVTNTTEQLSYPQMHEPCPDPSFALRGTSCAVMHWQDDKSQGPNAKTVTTTAFRVTNIVEVMRDGHYVLTDVKPFVFEIGRETLWQTNVSFSYVTEKKWIMQTNSNGSGFNFRPGGPTLELFTNGGVIELRVK